MSLHYAVCRRDISMVERLLDEGADPNEKNDEDNTPLFLSCYRQALIEIVYILLERGADPNFSTESPPLYLAAALGHGEITRLLLDRGADHVSIDVDHNNDPSSITCINMINTIPRSIHTSRDRSMTYMSVCYSDIDILYR